MIAEFNGYIAHNNKRVAKANLFALILAIDQLLYAPTLYLYLGKTGAAAWPVALTAPFFAFTPWLSRRHSLGSRVWLPFIGILTTAVAQLALGSTSGAWVFYLPSLALAGLLLRHDERLALLLLVSLAMLLFLFLPAQASALPLDQAHDLARLNGGSAIILTAFIGWIFAYEGPG